MTEPSVIEVLIARRLRCLDSMRANIHDEKAFKAAARMEAEFADRIRHLRELRALKPSLNVHPYFQTEE